jgi:hypothetical protein
MGHRVHPQPCEAYIQVVKLLSSAVNNINQIARVANTNGQVSENDICYLKIMAQKLWDKFKEMD